MQHVDRCLGAERDVYRVRLGPENPHGDLAHLCARNAECWLRHEREIGVQETIEVINAIVAWTFTFNVPATQIVLGGEERRFQAGGLSRLHWSNATPIRAVFKAAFEGASLTYANPHAFRKTLAQLGERLCQTPEEFKAWSQNLGHDQVLTTFSSYGNLTGSRQAELIRNLAHRSRDASNVDPIGQAMRLLEQARHQSL